MFKFIKIGEKFVYNFFFMVCFKMKEGVIFFGYIFDIMCFCILFKLGLYINIFIEQEFNMVI